MVFFQISVHSDDHKLSDQSVANLRYKDPNFRSFDINTSRSICIYYKIFPDKDLCLGLLQPSFNLPTLNQVL